MAFAKVMDNGVSIDTIKADLVEKEGKKYYFIKKYAKQSNVYKPFEAVKAFPEIRKGKSVYTLFIDHETLDQLSIEEAFINKKEDRNTKDLNRDASDILGAHKESNRRLGAEKQNLAVLISWIAIIIVALLMTINVYFETSNPIRTTVTVTGTVTCTNCNGAYTAPISGTSGVNP